MTDYVIVRYMELAFIMNNGPLFQRISAPLGWSVAFTKEKPYINFKISQFYWLFSLRLGVWSQIVCISIIWISQLHGPVAFLPVHMMTNQDQFWPEILFLSQFSTVKNAAVADVSPHLIKATENVIVPDLFTFWSQIKNHIVTRRPK